MDTVRSADGTTIAFERTGDGPPLIVVGGALSDRSAAADLAAVLAARFSVVAYDRRGRGDSGDTPPYAVEREVEDLAALLDAVGGSGFVLGHSSGAALAIEAVIRGLPITKLAVYEPPFIVDDTRPPLPTGYDEHLDELLAEGRRGDAVAYFMTTGVGLPSAVVDQMRGAPMWPAMEALAHTIAYDGRVMGDHMSGRPLPAGWASDVTIPTLVIDGGNSPDWARNAVSAVAAAIPGAERRTLDGQEHGAAPEVLAPVLETFFAA
ncbi:MAG: alpha/beta fold hydrolase [Actinomycetota bacterium]